MTQASMERARQLLALALEIDAGAIGEDTAIGREERWDSLAHLRIIEAVEEAIGGPLDPETIVAVEGFADIVAILEGNSR